MFLSGYQSLRALRVSVCRIVCVMFPLLVVVPFAAAQGLEPGAPADMGSFAVGRSSANVAFTFTPSASTTIAGITVYAESKRNADFVLTSGATQNCTGTITAGNSCTINLTFSPQVLGLRRGTVVLADGFGNTLFTQYVYGLGLGPQVSFSPVSATVLSNLSSFSPKSFTPSSAVYDGAGNLYFFDYQNGRLFLLDNTNQITQIGTFAGNEHSSLALNGQRTLYLTLPTGVEALATNGSGATLLPTPGITIASPGGIAVDGGGYIYVTDSQNGRIIRIAPGGASATVVPTTGLTLSSPYGLAVDYNNLYVADSGNGRIVAISIATGAATALTSTNALNQPFGIAVDASGTLIVANAGGSNLVQVSPTGTVTPVVPNSGVAIASAPRGVAVTTDGDYVSADASLGLVTITRGSDAQLVFPTPTKENSADGTDGYETMTLQNSGNQSITFSATTPIISNADFYVGPTNTCPVDQVGSLPIASSCTYSFGFTPSLVGTDQSIISIRGTAAGTGAFLANTDTLIGTGISAVDAFTVTTTPTSTTPGAAVGFTVTALQNSATLTTFTGTVTFAMTDSSGTFLGGSTYNFTSADVGTHTFPAALGAKFNTPGTYTIRVTYNAVTGVSNQVVVLYASSTALTSSSNPTILGGQTTLTATVTPVGTTLVPTTTVTFFDGTTNVGTCTLAAGKCTLTPALPVGSGQSLTAVYGGDTNFAASTSNTILQTVPGFNATFTLTSSANPSLVSQPVTFTATETPTAGQPGATVPSGTVTITNAGSTLCIVTLNAGSGSCNMTYAAAGSYAVKASYTGDSYYAAATANTVTQVVNQSTPKIALTSSANPGTLNTALTYTATMTPPTGLTTVPTGTVTFTSNGATLCAAVGLTAGKATCAHTYTAAGSYPIIATYNGNTIYNTVASTTLTEQILFNSTTTMTASPNPTSIGATVTLSATVLAAAGQTGAGQPAGTVTFNSGATAIGTCTLVGTTCSTTAKFTAAGTPSLTAVYGGSATFKTSTSTAATETIAAYTATVLLTSSVNPSSLHQQTTLTATVAPAAGQTTPPAIAGSVSFYDGTALLGSCILAGGTCTNAVSFTATGPHSLTAVYSGSASYGGLTSSIYTQTVTNLFSSQIAVNATPTTVALNTPVTFAATVIATPGQAGAGTPSGMVKFSDGAAPLGTCNLVSGACSISPSFTTAGAHSITATYNGDLSFNPSTTATAITETVNGLTPAVGMTSSINPSAVNAQTLLTASVVPAAGQNATTVPTGTINFEDGSTVIATCTLTSGTCSMAARFSTAGTHSLTAVYSGDTTFNPQSSAIYQQVVANYLATIALSATPSPVFLNNTVGLTATVATATAGGPVPSGTVTFLNGTTSLGSAAVVNGVATLSTSFPAVNTYSITAIYNGDTNYSTLTSTASSIVVEDFTFALATPSGGSTTVMGGHAATYTFTVTPVGGATFPAGINLSLAGFPANSTYTFSPLSLASGSAAATVTLTITPPAVALLEKPQVPGHSRELPITFALLLLPFALRFRGKRGRRPAALLLWLMMIAGALSLTGCLSDANSGYYGATQQTYSLTATASSGSLSHSAGATLVTQ